MQNMKYRKTLRNIAIVLAVICFLAETLIMFELARMNQTPEMGDQGAYLELAANIRDGRGFVSDRLSPFKPTSEIRHREGTRQPLYPYILSLAAGRDIGFLMRAKYMTAVIGLLLLATVFLTTCRRWGACAGFVAFVLLAVNVSFLSFSVQVWCENLLLLMLVACWWLMAKGLECLKTKSDRMFGYFAFAGFFLGMAWLSKTTASAMLVGCVAAVACLPKQVIWKERLKAAGVVGIFALIVILPHLIRNWIVTGDPLYAPEVRGIMWLDSGRQFWQVYDEIPTWRTYFESHTISDALVKWTSGLQRVLVAILRSLRDHPTRVPGGWMVLPLFFWGIYKEKREMRVLVLAMVLLNIAGFAWYAHVDVAPRFVYIPVVFIYIYGAYGLVSLLKSVRYREIPISKYATVCVLGLILIWTFAGFHWYHTLAKVSVTPTGNELATIDALEKHVAPEDILCMGPSHQLAYYWVIDRRRIFVPIFTDLEDFHSYLREYNAKYFLMDSSIYYRRKDLFAEYFLWDPVVGLIPRKPIPWLEKIYSNEGEHLQFLLYKIK